MKKAIGITTGFLSYLSYAAPAFAQSTVNLCGGDQRTANLLCTFNFGSLGGLISRLITILIIVAVVAALFFLIYGGIKWITSGGDKAAVDAARNHIVAAIVGLVIALLAFFIIQFIGGIFGVSLTDLQIPVLRPGAPGY